MPKDEEIVVDRPHELSQSNKDIAFYETGDDEGVRRRRRVLRPMVIGIVVFANKTTASWEAF